MNLKKVFLVLFVAAILFPISAQQGKDVVLVVDTSSSMFSYYNEVGTYLSGPFLAGNVAIGDTLHIISFGSKPRFEIARRISGEGDIETASARIWLLYPLEPSSDPGAAISYAEQYTRSIQGGRPKKVFIVSGNDLSDQVNSARGRFAPGTELIFIRAGSRMSQGQPIASTSQSGAPSTTAPSGNSTTPDSMAVSDPVKDQAGGNQVNENTANKDQINPDTPPGDPRIPADNKGTTEPGSQGNGGIVVDPAARTGGFDFQNIPLPLIIALALLLLLLLLFIIFRVRNLQSSPKKAMAQFASERSGDSNGAELLNSYANRQAEAALQGPNRRYFYRNTSNQFLTQPPMLNIFVEEQNTAIGRRNIHAMKKGATYSVGGGNSDFLIFLVKFPSGLGRLYFDGKNCTFTPLKSEYFPDIGSTPVPECIGKPIRIISSKKYEVFFHFEPYKDPLIEMNQLLNSIKVPEPPMLKKP